MAEMPERPEVLLADVQTFWKMPALNLLFQQETGGEKCRAKRDDRLFPY